MSDKDWKQAVNESTCPENHGCGTMRHCVCSLAEDMVDTITALRAENERLRGALEECRDVLSENVMYLPEPGQAANAIAYAEKLLKVEE